MFLKLHELLAIDYLSLITALCFLGNLSEILMLYNFKYVVHILALHFLYKSLYY